MARRPVLRPSYASDANYLVRLATAVEADDTRPVEWRRGVSALLQELAARLSEATPNQGGKREP